MVFVDTSALYALAYRPDRNHARAAACSQHLKQQQTSLWTATHIVQEYWYLLDARIGSERADRAIRVLLDGSMQVKAVEDTDIADAVEISASFGDQDFPLADRISFVLMERLGRSTVWTYDHDFAVYRFGPDHRQAFELVH